VASLLCTIPARADDAPVHTSSLPSNHITFAGGDRREAPERFAARVGLDPTALAARYGATGVVRCGAAVGTAQLVLSPDVIATAAHNIFDQTGRLRAEAGRCRFEITMAGERQVVPLDLKRTVAGSATPYADPAVNDWAVVPLARPVAGANPYPLAGAIALPAAITLYAAARADGSTGALMEACAARRVTNAAAGVRELALDCSGESGTSGAAFLIGDGRFAGIYVGFRSRAPHLTAPFSEHHYNFGVTAEGAFRRALIAAAAASAGHTAAAR
jgi:hypothetical protein